MTRRSKLQLQFQPICTRLPTACPSSEAGRRLRGMSSTLCRPPIEHRVEDGSDPPGGSASPVSEAGGRRDLPTQPLSTGSRQATLSHACGDLRI